MRPFFILYMDQNSGNDQTLIELITTYAELIIQGEQY